MFPITETDKVFFCRDLINFRRVSAARILRGGGEHWKSFCFFLSVNAKFSQSDRLRSRINLTRVMDTN